MKIRIKSRQYKGFSFIESILSVFILSVGIIAVLELMTSSINVSLEAKNYHMAVSLAQEGVELVRNVRDNNWTGFSSLSHGNNCRIDMNTNISCSDTSFRLYLDNQGFYTHTSSSKPTRFYRKVILERAGDIYKVTSMVIWEGLSFPAVGDCNEIHHCAYVKSVLKNWKK